MGFLIYKISNFNKKGKIKDISIIYNHLHILFIYHL